MSIQGGRTEAIEVHLGFYTSTTGYIFIHFTHQEKRAVETRKKQAFYPCMIMSPLPAFHPSLLNPTSLDLACKSCIIHTLTAIYTVHHRLVSAYGGQQENLFWAWVALLNIILSTFIYLPVNFMVFFLFTADWYSLGDMYHVSFLYWPGNTFAGSISLLWWINSTAAITVQINSSEVGYGVWGSMPRSGIAGLCAGSIFNCLRTLQTDFHDNRIKFHSHQQWMRALLPHISVRFLNDSLGRLDDVSG